MVLTSDRLRSSPGDVVCYLLPGRRPCNGPGDFRPDLQSTDPRSALEDKMTGASKPALQSQLCLPLRNPHLPAAKMLIGGFPVKGKQLWQDLCPAVHSLLLLQKQAFQLRGHEASSLCRSVSLPPGSLKDAEMVGRDYALSYQCIRIAITSYARYRRMQVGEPPKSFGAPCCSVPAGCLPDDQHRHHWAYSFEYGSVDCAQRGGT